MSCFNPFSSSRINTLAAVFAACLWAWLPLSVWGQDGPAIIAALEDNFTRIIETAEPSVVSIARIGKRPIVAGDRSGELQNPDTASANPEDFVPSEFGAGVVFEPADQPGKRLILTMYHVVKGGQVAGRPGVGDELVIHTHKRQKARVEIVAADPRSDLAVLQIPEDDPLKPADLTPIRIGETPHYKKGQFVITLGNPYAIARDGSACAGWGMLSNISRCPKPAPEGLSSLEKNKRETIHHQGTLLQIDGQLNLGTSGGAVLNRKGELIGIITAMAALDGYEKSVGYAVPLNQGIRRVITELAHGYEVEYGLLGIQPLTVPFPAGPQPTATKVDTVGPNSPAAKAGLIRDDLIHAVNGVTIYNQEDLMREVALIGPGQKAKLQLFRPRTREWLTKEVTLTKWPVYNDEDIIATRQRHVWNVRAASNETRPNLILAIDYATARYEFFGQEQQYRPAVLITQIQGDSPEQHSQFRVGDFITHVNDVPVRSPEEFEAVMKRITSETVKLRLWDRTVSVPAVE